MRTFKPVKTATRPAKRVVVLSNDKRHPYLTNPLTLSRVVAVYMYRAKSRQGKAFATKEGCTERIKQLLQNNTLKQIEDTIEYVYFNENFFSFQLVIDNLHHFKPKSLMDELCQLRK